MKQKIKAILDDDRGVSPVIGVILMVAITVILAAVIGTFVLGLGDSLQQAPQSQISVASDSTNSLNISHNGGDPLPQSEILINVDGNDNTSDFYGNVSGSDDVFNVGESMYTKSPEFGDTVTVTVIHEPSESILLEKEVDVQS
jgi:flagellin-like protein